MSVVTLRTAFKKKKNLILQENLGSMHKGIHCMKQIHFHHSRWSQHEVRKHSFQVAPNHQISELCKTMEGTSWIGAILGPLLKWCPKKEIKGGEKRKGERERVKKEKGHPNTSFSLHVEYSRYYLLSIILWMEPSIAWTIGSRDSLGHSVSKRNRTGCDSMALPPSTQGNLCFT